jgi:hypothetical protein
MRPQFLDMISIHTIANSGSSVHSSFWGSTHILARSEQEETEILERLYGVGCRIQARQFFDPAKISRKIRVRGENQPESRRRHKSASLSRLVGKS